MLRAVTQGFRYFFDPVRPPIQCWSEVFDCSVDADGGEFQFASSIGSREDYGGGVRTCMDRCRGLASGNPSSTWDANAGHQRGRLEPCVYGPKSDLRRGKNYIFLLGRGGCLGGSGDPVDRRHYQQAQDQSEPAHVTKPGYSRTGLRSTKITHFDANMFLVRSCKSSVSLLLNRRYLAVKF